MIWRKKNGLWIMVSSLDNVCFWTDYLTSLILFLHVTEHDKWKTIRLITHCTVCVRIRNKVLKCLAYRRYSKKILLLILTSSLASQ